MKNKLCGIGEALIDFISGCKRGETEGCPILLPEWQAERRRM